MGSSVLWCHIRLIWVACGSLATCLMCHAVAFELSNFFANWQTLLLENFSRSTLPSVMILDTKSSSHRKNQSMLQCNIFAVSGRYFSKFTCACTALYHSLTLLFPWWKLVNISNQACTSWIAVYRSLQTSPILCLGSCLLWIAPGYIFIHSKVARPHNDLFTLLMFGEGSEFTFQNIFAFGFTY